MRTIGLVVHVETVDIRKAFDQISDFGRYPVIAPDVHAVEMRPPAEPGGPRESDWEVNFRRGIMRWTEHEFVDADRLTIEFDQTDGDFEAFRGHWALTPSGHGCEVFFEVTYDFGIESLAGIMDPIAERVIKRVVCAVLVDLFGEITVRSGGAALTDLAGQETLSGVHIVRESDHGHA